MLVFGLYDTANVGNAMSWGLLIAVFAFLVGFGAGSQFLASLIVLLKKDHLLPWATLAQAIALAGGCGAGVAIIADLGSPWNMLAMILSPNPASPLTWDMLALSAFVVVSLKICRGCSYKKLEEYSCMDGYWSCSCRGATNRGRLIVCSAKRTLMVA